MNKKVFALALALALGCTMAVFAGCDESSGSGSGNSAESGKHIRDEAGMGGENVLDDGGEINFSDPVLKATGVRFDVEHRILLGQDEDKYELVGGSVISHDWFSGTFNRVRCGSGGGIIFTLDLSEVEDLTRAGLMINLINNRGSTEINISLDGESWQPIGYPDQDYNGIRGDYTEHAKLIYNYETGEEVDVTSDANIYQCYYDLSAYAMPDQPLYIWCTYNNTSYWTGLPDKSGADIIAYVSLLEGFEIVEEYI